MYNVSPSFEAVAIGLAMFIGNAISGYFYSYSSVLAVFQCTIYIQYIFMHNNNTFVCGREPFVWVREFVWLEALWWRVLLGWTALSSATAVRRVDALGAASDRGGP